MVFDSKTGEWADLDDGITAWHESDSELPLYTYLGMTWDEYRRWVGCDLDAVRSAGTGGVLALQLVADDPRTLRDLEGKWLW